MASPDRIPAIAAELRAARASLTAVDQLEGRWGALSLDEAYAIQHHDAVTAAGSWPAAAAALDGFKLGFTSRAKMAQMNLSTPIYGLLPRGSRVATGATLSRAAYIQPRVEPELAVVVGRSIPLDMHPDEAWLRLDHACAAMELLDSRYRDYKFSVTDVIADNTSAAGYLLGSERLPLSRDLGNLGVLFYKNGILIEAASTAAALEHPKHAFAALLTMLRGHGLTELTEGAVILTGGLTAAHAMAPGDHARIILEGLGAVDLHFAS